MGKRQGKSKRINQDLFFSKKEKSAQQLTFFVMLTLRATLPPAPPHPQQLTPNPSLPLRGKEGNYMSFD